MKWLVISVSVVLTVVGVYRFEFKKGTSPVDPGEAAGEVVSTDSIELKNETLLQPQKEEIHELNESIKTVYVRTFDIGALRTSPFQGFEVDITAEVARKLKEGTSLKAVSEHTQADTELICKIVSIKKNILNETQTNSVKEGEIVLSAEVHWRDLRNGKILTTPASNHSEALKSEPIRIVATGRFIMELGETTATAVQKAELDIADQIVSLMQKQ